MNSTNLNTDAPGKKFGNRRGRQVPRHLPVLNADVAGIDVGSQRHYVSVPEDRDPQPVQRFDCYTTDLQRMGDWLLGCGVQSVVMESTGVYWIPVFRVLEAKGLEVTLVNPRHIKHVPGRKTDVLDCQWLRQLHSYGLLRGSFVPPQDVAAMRSYWRQRHTLVRDAARATQHMQKALTLMNLHLHVVLSDIAGVSGMKMLRAMVAGERDPEKLACLAHPSVKAPKEEFVKALSGHYTQEHLFTLRQSLQQFDFLHKQIEECDQQLARYLERYPTKADPATVPDVKKSRSRSHRNRPHFDLRSELIRITGVDLTHIDSIDALTAFTIVSEIGFDLSAFPDEKHFASWTTLAPNNQKTGDKIKRRRTLPSANRVATALRIAAQSLHRSHTYLGALYRRLRARLGAPKAITALARRLAVLVYRMLRYGQDYVDQGEQKLEQQYRDRTLKNLAYRAKQFGLELIDPQSGECLT